MVGRFSFFIFNIRYNVVGVQVDDVWYVYVVEELVCVLEKLIFLIFFFEPCFHSVDGEPFGCLDVRDSASVVDDGPKRVLVHIVAVAKLGEVADTLIVFVC